MASPRMLVCRLLHVGDSSIAKTAWLSHRRFGGLPKGSVSLFLGVYQINYKGFDRYIISKPRVKRLQVQVVEWVPLPELGELSSHRHHQFEDDNKHKLDNDDYDGHAAGDDDDDDDDTAYYDDDDDDDGDGNRDDDD
eukprot:3424941-Amphidinium_carterae.5